MHFVEIRGHKFVLGDKAWDKYLSMLRKGSEPDEALGVLHRWGLIDIDQMALPLDFEDTGS